MEENEIKGLDFTHAIRKIQNSPHTLRRLKYTLHGISPENPTYNTNKIIYITTLLGKYETQKNTDAKTNTNAKRNADANTDADAKTKTQKVALMPLDLPSSLKMSSPRTTDKEKYKMMQKKINNKSESNKDRFLESDARLSRYNDTKPDKNHINEKADRACLISNMNVDGHDFGYACQYPKNEMIAPFYSFLYQEKIQCVNAISTEGDKNKHKLIRYFLPSSTQNMELRKRYDIPSSILPEGMTVITEKIEETHSNALYQLDLTLNNRTRTINLLHTFEWRDHEDVSIKALDEIVTFRKLNDLDGKKTVTHCTAGVGRTGVVLAAHALSLYPELDPLSVVTNLRACRNNLMVQTPQQTDLLLDWDINHRIPQTPYKDIKPQKPKPLIVFKDPIYENAILENHTYQNYPYETEGHENQGFEQDDLGEI